MARTTSYEDLIVDHRARSDFFEFYDALIADCKKYGFMNAAIAHAKNRKRIWDEVTMLD